MSRSVGMAAAFVAAVGAVAVALPGCGSIYGGGGGGPKFNLTGNIEATLPGDAGHEIVVFVYRLKDDDPFDCDTPDLPDNDDVSKSERLAEGQTEFEVRGARAGRVVIAFLLDGIGDEADGRIDPGDPYAVLNDPDCVLDDVPKKSVVDLQDLRINFTADDEPDFPAANRAEADAIVEADD